MNTNELEDRLINFAVAIIKIVNKVENNYVGNYYSNQIIRSTGSSALNYGEARSAESYKDFVHKMGICLKELRESNNCLKIIHRANLFKGESEDFDKALDENNQLIAIFVASIKTSKDKNSEFNNR